MNADYSIRLRSRAPAEFHRLPGRQYGLSAQEADVFFVDVDVQEAADLALVVAQVRLQVRELLVENREQFSEIRAAQVIEPTPSVCRRKAVGISP